MTPDALQAVYDRVLSWTETATPRPLLSAAAADWFGRMRRLRWVAAWLENATPGSTSPIIAPPLPPPAPPPPGSGVDDFVVNPTDQPITIRADAEWHDEDTGTDTTLGPSDGETDQGAGPSDQGTPITLVPTDGTDNPTDAAVPTWLEQVDASAAAITTSRTIFSAPPGSGTMLCFFGSGALDSYWQVYTGTWSQAAGALNCDAVASGHAVIVNTAISPSVPHTVTITRPAAGGGNCGPAACMTLAGGLVSGYAVNHDGANATLYRIDAGVWTSIGAAAVAWAAGTTMSLTRSAAAASSPAGSFTTFTPSVDTRQVFVSATGNDANDGLSSATPKLTIAAGVALLRDGFPDWLLLKAGDTFTNQAFAANWLLSGRSPSERMLIGAYGSGARPVVRMTDAPAFRRQGGGASPAVLANLAMVGLRLEGYLKTPSDTSSLVSIIKETHDLLIEDCVFYGAGQAINCIGALGALNQNIVVNRCIMAEMDSTNAAHNQCFYASYTTGIVVTDCVLDHNHFTNPDQFKHNIYIDSNCGPVVFERNITTRACCNGAQIRPGGSVRYNIASECPISFLVADGDGSIAGQGVNTIEYNVSIAGTDVAAGTLRGWGIDSVGCKAGSKIRYNIIGNKTSTNVAHAIGVTPSSVTLAYGATEIAFNRIFNHYGGIMVDENNGLWTITGVTIHDNDIEERRGGASAYLQQRLRFSTWAGTTYSNNVYHHANTSTPHSQGGAAKTEAQWESLSGETGATWAQAASSRNPIPTLAAAVNAIKGTAYADTAAVAAALIARARGTWDNDLAGDTLYAYFAEQFGGSLVVKINAATVLTVTDGAYTAGLGGIAAAAPTTAATAWSLT